MFNIIQKDIKEAMFTKNTVKRDCLRSVISEIKNQTINAGKEITNDICINVLQKFVKTHNDSIKQFTEANRMDLVNKEKEELKYLEAYLPTKLNDFEMKTLVSGLIDQNNIDKTKKNMGQIMKLLAPKRNVLDMAEVSKYLNTILI